VTPEEDRIDRHINDLAKRSFRDIADRDYIAARLSARSKLVPQFLWQSQQAIEKYLKYILLVNRVDARRVGHDLKKALALVDRLPIGVKLRAKSRTFLDHIADYGPNRYLDYSYHFVGHALPELDMTVWDLRRYCQILDVKGKVLPEVEQQMLKQAVGELIASEATPPYKFKLRGGFLEEVMNKRKHPAREALLWNNAFFGTRNRRHIRSQQIIYAENAPLYLFPEMLDEVLKYIHVPKAIEAAYRQHLAAVRADPASRP
jgi:HEPN domain-containing protein